MLTLPVFFLSNRHYLYIPLLFLSICILFTVQFKNGMWAYSFFSIFSVLGYTLKVGAHTLFGYPYIEPTGNFDSSYAQWNQFYVFTITIFVAILASWVFLRLLPRRVASLSNVMTPRFGDRGYIFTIAIFIVFAILLFLFNWKFRIFVTGLEPILILPFSLNAPVAFFVYIGCSLILSYLVGIHLMDTQEYKKTIFFLLLIFFSCLSISLGSRAILIMQFIPVSIAYFSVADIPRRTVVLYCIYSFISLVIVLTIVSYFRISQLSDHSVEDSDFIIYYFGETILLSLDRWIGVEGVMTAVGEKTSGLALMKDLLFENPAAGTDALYQKLSGGFYQFRVGTNYGTIPGIGGILAHSSSSLVLFLGVLSIVMFMIIYEHIAASVLSNNKIVVSLIGVTLANHFIQLNFVRLLLPFIFQMTILICLIGLFSRVNKIFISKNDVFEKEVS